MLDFLYTFLITTCCWGGSIWFFWGIITLDWGIWGTLTIYFWISSKGDTWLTLVGRVALMLNVILGEGTGWTKEVLIGLGEATDLSNIVADWIWGWMY